MDEGLIYYIILAVIALLSQVLKKSKKSPTNRPSPSQEGQEDRPQRKPFSFEDILKEFEAEVLDKEPEVEKERPYRRPIPQTEPEPLIEMEEKIPSMYEGYEGTSYQSLESLESLEDKPKKEKRLFKRDESYAIEESEPPNILQELLEYDGAKKAIIYSEIINRKYD